MVRVRRTPPHISKKCHPNRTAAALAPRAAGGAVLSGTLPAEARVIYTPANVQIAPHHHFLVDLNHDGIADFVISNHVFRSIDIGGRTLRELWESNLRSESTRLESTLTDQCQSWGCWQHV